MAKNNNLTDFLVDIGDSIREKTKSSGPINPQDFSEIIRGLTTGEYNIESVILEDGSQELRIISTSDGANVSAENIKYMELADLIASNLYGGDIATKEEYEIAESQFQILAQRIIGGING